MEKKYQVFVSSTYEDLQEERKKVMEALLQMNCFPVGMEYFNASDSSQWEVIKSLIRECDYYVLIVAGRYGSIEEESGKAIRKKSLNMQLSKEFRSYRLYIKLLNLYLVLKLSKNKSNVINWKSLSLVLKRSYASFGSMLMNWHLKLY